MQKNNEILVNYYNGAYGMTIRIDVENESALLRLRKFIADMAGDIIEKPFSDIGACEIVGLKTFDLKQLQAAPKNGKSVFVTNGCVRWENPFEEWIRCAGLIDGLLECKKPRHQYLNQEADGVIIELSYLKG
jgi:hypothetical protein